MKSNRNAFWQRGLGVLEIALFLGVVFLAWPMAGMSKPTSSPVASIQEAKINLNSATSKDLMKIPGVGQKKAQEIITVRNKNRFNRIDDLLQVKGIGPKKLEKIRPYVTVRD